MIEGRGKRLQKQDGQKQMTSLPSLENYYTVSSSFCHATLNLQSWIVRNLEVERVNQNKKNPDRHDQGSFFREIYFTNDLVLGTFLQVREA